MLEENSLAKSKRAPVVGCYQTSGDGEVDGSRKLGEQKMVAQHVKSLVARRTVKSKQASQQARCVIAVADDSSRGAENKCGGTGFREATRVLKSSIPV